MRQVPQPTREELRRFFIALVDVRPKLAAHFYQSLLRIDNYAGFSAAEIVLYRAHQTESRREMLLNPLPQNGHVSSPLDEKVVD